MSPTTDSASQPAMITRQGAITALLLAATASRLVPHAPNFTAVPAVALLGGMLLGRTWLSLFVPLLAMLLSDCLLGAFVYGARAFEWLLPVYASVSLTVVIGWCTQRRWLSVIAAALAATLTFFVVTNFCVWLGSTMYPKTAAGLLMCYAAALPFAGNMLLSSVAFALGLLCLWNLAQRRFPALAEVR